MILLTPAEHAHIRPVLLERTTARLTPRLLEDARSADAKADARMDARLLAGRIVDDLLGVLTTEAPVKRSLATLIAAAQAV